MTTPKSIPSELPTPNWSKWARRDLWTLFEAAALLAEREPLDGAIAPDAVRACINNATAREQFDEAYGALKRATSIYKNDRHHPKGLRFFPPVALAGFLFTGRRQVEPIDVIQWAPKKRIQVPKPLLDAFSEDIKKKSHEDNGQADAAEDWKTNARRIGAEIFKRKPRLTVEKIADKTHEEMTKRKNTGEPGMTGRGGKVPSADTIKRHALTGIKA